MNGECEYHKYVLEMDKVDGVSEPRELGFHESADRSGCLFPHTSDFNIGDEATRCAQYFSFHHKVPSHTLKKVFRYCKDKIVAGQRAPLCVLKMSEDRKN